MEDRHGHNASRPCGWVTATWRANRPTMSRANRPALARLRGLRLLDLGVGMDFRHPDPPDLVGRRITVRLPVGGSFDITFTGEVRNTKAGPDGVVRVGIEFVGLSEDELYIVDLLELGS